jgi:hypothetical protein
MVVSLLTSFEIVGAFFPEQFNRKAENVIKPTKKKEVKKKILLVNGAFIKHTGKGFGKPFLFLYVKLQLLGRLSL